MTVEEANKVDVIGVETSSGKLVLTISDHLDWTNGDEHALILQAKLNAYLAFIESGELLEQYADAEGRPIVIDLVMKYPLSSEGHAFLVEAVPILSQAGVELRCKLLRP